MKILVVQDHLRSGGTERQSVLLANAFAAAGHGTTLLTFRPGGALDPTVAATVNRHSLQPFDLGLDWFAPGLRRTVARLAPDIVLCMGRMANCYAGILQHDAARSAVIATMRTGKKIPALFRRSLVRCRHVIANSHDARETLIGRHGVAPDRVSVIHNSLVFPAATTDEAAARSLRAAERSRLGTAPGAFVLLCVAMFRPEKNQRELIEIVAGLPADANWELWLAGDGPARAACEALAATRGIAARVRFPGFQHNPTALYQAADLAVHASWSEALSNFLIEAQAHGLPFVAYEAQGIGECGLPGRTAWPIARGDRDAFRAAVRHWLNESPATRAAAAAAARRFARETFDPARQVAAYLDLFARLGRR